MKRLSSRSSWYETYFPFACGSLSLVWQALFFFIPLAFVITLGFTGESWFGNFEPFFSWIYAKIILRSICMAGLTALICLAIAYPFAYFLVFYAGRFVNAFLFLIMLPFWTNFLLHICAWFYVLDRQGLVSMLLLRLGIINEPLHILNSLWAVGIMMVYFYLPFMILPLYAAFDRFDKRLLEASLDLGATWRQTIARVLIPLTMSGIRVGFLLVFIPAFGEFAIPEFMGGDRTLFAGSVITHFILGTESDKAGAAFTLVCSLVLVIITGVIYWLMGRYIPRHYGEEEEL